MAHPGRPLKCDPKVDNLRSNIQQEDYATAKATLNEFGVDAIDGDGRTVLINAVIEAKEDFIDWLFQSDANINHQDRIGYSALHFIAQNNQFNLGEKFLSKGANPNIQDIHGNTPLWTAIFESKKEFNVVKLLLKYGADPNVLNKYGKTPSDLFKTIYRSSITNLT